MRISFAKAALASAAVLAILFGACSSEESSDRQEPGSASTTSSTAVAQGDDAGGTTSTAPSQGTGPVDAQRAVEIALTAAPGAVVVEVDEDRGVRAQWEVVALNRDGSGTELRIDTATGEVISRAPKGLDPEARTAPAISAPRAMEIAVATAPGEIVEVDLDSEGGRTVWDVEVRVPSGPKQHLTIDATTGAIIRQSTG